MKVLPLFTSAYSFKSILTLESSEKGVGPRSIVSLCREKGLEKLFLVENSMSAFLKAHSSCGSDIQLVYGLRLLIGDSETIESEKLSSIGKYIIFGRTPASYEQLIRISTLAHTDGFVDGVATLNFKTLEKNWSDDLVMAIPFYDSFIHKNCFTFSSCIPSFGFCDPVFFTEDNGLFFDEHLASSVRKYCEHNNHKVIPAKSIFYNKRKDFLSWMTYRCIEKRTSMEKPEMEFCSSQEFCLEAWEEAR